MLYITTRSTKDAFTAHRTLLTDKAPDGGFFIPMRFPAFSDDQLRELLSESFETIIAKILNTFFRADITQWDVGFCFSRNTLRLIDMNPKIYLAELWHNTGNGMGYIMRGLFRRVFGGETELEPSEWFRIVVKIAFFFGIYAELQKLKFIRFGDAFDLSVPADDVTYPIAVLYAAKMGLPIGNIICNSVTNQELWTLIHRGEFSVGETDNDFKSNIERLLQLRLGEVNLNIRSLSFEADRQEKIKEGLFCVVSGSERVLQMITSTFRNTERLLTPDTALCIAGLGDYRAKTGENRYTLVIEENSPLLFPAKIERATGLPARKIGDYLKE